MVAREMLKDFVKKYSPDERTERCPFYHWEYRVQMHELCAVIFPKWGKKYLSSTRNSFRYTHCPCATLSINYIRRKSQEFVKKNK